MRCGELQSAQESRHGARGAESRVACDVLRPCDLLDAPLGVGLCIDDFVATGQQHYAARPKITGAVRLPTMSTQ